MQKQYGLIKPGVTPKPLVRKPAIFADSDEEDSDDNQLKSGPLKPSGLRNSEFLKARDSKLQKKAIQEDPTVYQYDEIYDQIIDDKVKSSCSLMRARDDIQHKPKYIQKMIAVSETRKKEFERRLERKIQKEREAEGNEFKDQDKLVTPAFRKKLEEMRERDDEEKRQDYLESIADVTKQQDLSGFYRHFYDQHVNHKEQNTTQNDEKKPQKNYRKQKAMSVSSTSDSENSASNEDITDVVNSINVGETEAHSSIAENKEEDKRVEVSDIEKMSQKPKIDIWKKRTVGDIFEEALKQYYERKAAQEVTS